MTQTSLDIMTHAAAEVTGRPLEILREGITATAATLGIEPETLHRQRTPEEAARLLADFREQRKKVAARLKNRPPERPCNSRTSAALYRTLAGNGDPDR